MTDDDRLRALLGSAFPETSLPPAPDLWPSVVARLTAPVKPSWLDVGLVAAIVTALAMVPGWLLLLAYHL